MNIIKSIETAACNRFKKLNNCCKSIDTAKTTSFRKLHKIEICFIQKFKREVKLRKFILEKGRLKNIKSIKHKNMVSIKLR